jgi:hypothetical protein
MGPKTGQKRNRREESGTDPVVETVKEMLEQNVEHFLGHITSYVEKYQRYHAEAAKIIAAIPVIEEGPRAPGTPASEESAQPDDGSMAKAVGVTKKPVVGRKVVVTQTDDEEVVEVEFPENEELKKQLKMLKKEAYELSTTLEGIMDWIDLLAPDKDKTQEDSTGAEVQDAVSEQISSLADSTKSAYDLEGKYLNERGEIEAAILGMPQVKSMVLQLEVYDADAWDEIERSWKMLLRVCLIAYSVVFKNMKRLKNPLSKSKDVVGYQ